MGHQVRRCPIAPDRPDGPVGVGMGPDGRAETSLSADPRITDEPLQSSQKKLNMLKVANSDNPGLPGAWNHV